MAMAFMVAGHGFHAAVTLDLSLSLLSAPVTVKTLPVSGVLQQRGCRTRREASGTANPNPVMLLLWAWEGTRVIVESLVAKPGCPDRCGNVSVPYPFGIRHSKCAKDMSFLLNCSHNGNSAELFNNYGKIVNIELLQGTTTVIIETVYACYDEKRSNTSRFVYYFDLESPFTVSDTRNEFIVTGCYMSGYLLDTENRVAETCNTTCDKPEIVMDNASCTGKGCCQTKISKGLKIIFMGVESMDKHSSSWQYNPCGYAFLAAQDSVDISKMTLWDNIAESQVVLDWVISEETCKEAPLNQSSYSSGHNALCSDSSNGPGHRCLCKEGFQGNPYLPQGCQDIDECLDTKRHPCEGTCKNTPGNYTCRCPLGMYGDGKVGCKGLRVTTLVADNFEEK
ncbi:hypothetical protein L1049_013143 [Liquidambar formosana]|uniref:EGF-like domain-containing protein n=1 Tax=Liquidambar formosana TaxID=63359 RepID=A0AAP0RK24_LIQFO